VTQQKRLGIMAMAGRSEEYVLCVRCGYTFENDYGGGAGEGEVRR